MWFIFPFVVFFIEWCLYQQFSVKKKYQISLSYVFIVKFIINYLVFLEIKMLRTPFYFTYCINTLLIPQYFLASVVTYSIIAGNTYDAFSITNYTGEIRVKNPLDYENITSYSLDVRASDGIFEDYAKVIISILNINDNPPVFMANYSKTIQEETVYNGCIVRVRV